MRAATIAHQNIHRLIKLIPVTFRTWNLPGGGNQQTLVCQRASDTELPTLGLYLLLSTVLCM